MTKNSVGDWDETAANNTDVAGVNINEGCAPAGINNAIRAVMAQIKTWVLTAVVKTGTPLVGNFPRFTDANTVEARTAAEVKSDIGLGSADNTADADKPISTATQTALDGKSATGHGHAISDVTSLQSSLDGKSATGHGHAISDVTSLQSSLDAKAASSHTHAISEVTSLQTSLDAKVPTSRNVSSGTGLSGGGALSADQTLALDFNSLTEETSPADTDMFAMRRASDGGYRKVQKSNIGGGTIVQVVNTQTGAVATGTATIPFDDTIPQNTEGTEFMTLAITPTSSSNKLRISVGAFLSESAGNRQMFGALFQDTTANALATAAMQPVNNTWPVQFCFEYVMTAGTTSATTFKFRAGSQSSSTTTFNGGGGARKFGGTAISFIIIEEIAV